MLSNGRTSNVSGGKTPGPKSSTYIVHGKGDDKSKTVKIKPNPSPSGGDFPKKSLGGYGGNNGKSKTVKLFSPLPSEGSQLRRSSGGKYSGCSNEYPSGSTDDSEVLTDNKKLLNGTSISFKKPKIKMMSELNYEVTHRGRKSEQAVDQPNNGTNRSSLRHDADFLKKCEEQAEGREIVSGASNLEQFNTSSGDRNSLGGGGRRREDVLTKAYLQLVEESEGKNVTANKNSQVWKEMVEGEDAVQVVDDFDHVEGQKSSIVNFRLIM